jgi:hypothetical protein
MNERLSYHTPDYRSKPGTGAKTTGCAHSSLSIPERAQTRRNPQTARASIGCRLVHSTWDVSDFGQYLSVMTLLLLGGSRRRALRLLLARHHSNH